MSGLNLSAGNSERPLRPLLIMSQKSDGEATPPGRRQDIPIMAIGVGASRAGFEAEWPFEAWPFVVLPFVELPFVALPFAALPLTLLAIMMLQAQFQVRKSEFFPLECWKEGGNKRAGIKYDTREGRFECSLLQLTVDLKLAFYVELSPDPYIMEEPSRGSSA